MRALVISGGGSKGAFAGGVSQYLIRDKGIQYDLFIGTSTGSLLLPHLALNHIEKIYTIYTSVDKNEIFSINPFIIKKEKKEKTVAINHFNVIWQFIRGKRTFGESLNLRKYIRANFSEKEFETLQNSTKNVVVTVTNLSQNETEYKSIKDCNYKDFCDWIWISCNYIPFMSLVTKNGSEYADGGFSSLVPIQEAINRGATEIDIIVLETETTIHKNQIGKNPFSLMIDLFRISLSQVEKHDIVIGKLAAKNKNVVLNLYFTPEKLTENALIFNKNQMKEWWIKGYNYAKNKNESNPLP
jgi:NTE family protein